MLEYLVRENLVSWRVGFALGIDNFNLEFICHLKFEN